VRTPMQWDTSRNAGFSTAPPEKLYAPVIDDVASGYQHVNVAAQLAAADSLLNWFKRVLRVRRQHPAFGRGKLQLIETNSPAVLSYLRCYPQENLVIVNNLSSSSQAVTLDLSQYAGQQLIDLFTDEKLARESSELYHLQIEGYGYRWLKLV
jgi:maltose alpha-D-glucosyltransferase / alpha-amylase